MYTIKKLKAPESSMKRLQSPKSILTKVPKNFDSNPKNTPRKIVFSDDIGKPLVEFRDISSNESISEVTWCLLRVKNARKPLEGALEMRKIEEKRLEDENVSRAPLFGTFTAFESPHLIEDANLRSLDPIPIIPLETPRVEVVPQLPQNQSQNTYQQVFESTTREPMCVDTPTTITTQSPSPAIFNLMAQLKQRGLVPAEQPPASDNVHPMPEQRRPSRFAPSWKRGVCTHYISNPKGCFHGDSCRFEHDDAQREAYQNEHRNRNSRAEHWRQRQNNSSFRGSGGGHRRFHRSRSPQGVV